MEELALSNMKMVKYKMQEHVSLGMALKEKYHETESVKSYILHTE